MARTWQCQHISWHSNSPDPPPHLRVTFHLSSHHQMFSKPSSFEGGLPGVYCFLGGLPSAAKRRDSSHTVMLLFVLFCFSQHCVCERDACPLACISSGDLCNCEVCQPLSWLKHCMVAVWSCLHLRSQLFVTLPHASCLSPTTMPIII